MAEIFCWCLCGKKETYPDRQAAEAAGWSFLTGSTCGPCATRRAEAWHKELERRDAERCAIDDSYPLRGGHFE